MRIIGATAREIDFESFVLPIEGLSPAEPIRAPALRLVDDEFDEANILTDSTDPAQLVVFGDQQTPLALADPVEAMYAEAREAADGGRTLEARSLYKELLNHTPGHIRARNNLALLLERTGDQAGALAEYDRALDIEAENPTLLTNRGALLGTMGRYAAAERDLKRVLRIDPVHAEALFHLGVVMTKKGLWGEAAEHLRRVVDVEPSRGPAHYYLGEAQNHVDDLAGAMASYLRAAELMPDNPRALYGLGIVYDRMGRPDDAARMYRKSREIGRR